MPVHRRTLVEFVVEQLKEPTVENLSSMVIGLAIGHQVLSDEVAGLKARIHVLERRQ